jgi:hypothetical protein
VRTYDDEQARLAIDRVGLSAYTFLPAPTQEDRELLLVRDVLDTQVVDLAGRRLSMVSDVLKVAGSHGLLDVAAVDVGAGSLPRRMGFRRLGDRLDPVVVDWAEVHPSGHLVQHATAATAMHWLDASELAHLLARLSTDMAVDVIRTRTAEGQAGHRFLVAQREDGRRPQEQVNRAAAGRLRRLDQGVKGHRVQADLEDP